jgi:hypothetical protein
MEKPENGLLGYCYCYKMETVGGWIVLFYGLDTMVPKEKSYPSKKWG